MMIRTKKYEFPLKRKNEALALRVFTKIRITDEGVPICFRNDCIYWAMVILLGFRDPGDFMMQALDAYMAKDGEKQG